MTNLEAAMQIINTYSKYEKNYGLNVEKLEAVTHAIFALAKEEKEEENQDDCLCGD